MNAESSLYGVGAEFASPGALIEAAGKIRAVGFTHFDVFSPYPVPGLSAAVGAPRSTLGKYVFLGGLFGFLSALLLVYIPSSYLYPLVVDGKPTGFFSIPAYFPVLFETTILFSALAAFVGLFLMIGLPRWNHPLFTWEHFKKASDDGFFCVIEQSDPRFSPGEVRALLEALGGTHITEIYEE